MKSKVCEHAGCNKIPAFNSPGERAARFCAAHKLEGMVNVKSKICEHVGCIKQPTFQPNIPGKKAGRFCHAHRMEGMVMVVGKKRSAAEEEGTSSILPHLAAVSGPSTGSDRAV